MSVVLYVSDENHLSSKRVLTSWIDSWTNRIHLGDNSQCPLSFRIDFVCEIQRIRHSFVCKQRIEKGIDTPLNSAKVSNDLPWSRLAGVTARMSELSVLICSMTISVTCCSIFVGCPLLGLRMIPGVST